MYIPTHEYSHEIQEADPRSEQPSKISVPLKPHQLAAIHKAQVMENEETFFIRPHGNESSQSIVSVSTNVGVLGDIVGYGKTLIGLGVIAQNPVENIKVYDDTLRMHQIGDAFFLSRTPGTQTQRATRNLIPSTLLIVPHGPVFEQWATALQTQTTLRYIKVACRKDITNNFPSPILELPEIQAAFNDVDVVLIKATMMNNMFDHFGPYMFRKRTLLNPAYQWTRIMIDEAHQVNTVEKLHHMCYNFLWFISGTYSLIAKRDGTYSHSVKEMFSWIQQEMPYCIVRNNPGFTKKSFVIPDFVEKTYVCKEPYGMRKLRKYMNKEIARMIDANDYIGAMRALGIEQHDEMTIVQYVTRRVQRELNNKQKELEYVEQLDIPAQEKTKRLETVRHEIERLQEKNDSLREQFQDISEKQCTICYETFSDMEHIRPMITPCNHIFCQACIYRWCHIDRNQTCPTCRNHIDLQNVVSIAWNDDKPGPSSAPSQPVPQLTKEEQLMEIIRKKSDGKFIIFSSYDHYAVYQALQANQITCAELKGTTASMVRTLEEFRNGNIKCILLNTYNTGSGIDISCATDIILLHGMGKIRHQAIGRAQRVGRTDVLTIHNLLHDGESILDD